MQQKGDHAACGASYANTLRAQSGKPSMPLCSPDKARPDRIVTNPEAMTSFAQMQMR